MEICLMSNEINTLEKIVGILKPGTSFLLPIRHKKGVDKFESEVVFESKARLLLRGSEVMNNIFVLINSHNQSNSKKRIKLLHKDIISEKLRRQNLRSGGSEPI